ncbi:MAG TPA: hypothetical protein VF789_23700 [Thermoanaerobaculia bacterium]
MRSFMARVFVICTLVLIGGITFTGEASACGMSCQNIAPAGQPPCFRCLENPNSMAACRDQGACGCIFDICWASAISPTQTDGEEFALASIFSDGSEPSSEATQCGALPAEITAL